MATATLSGEKSESTNEIAEDDHDEEVAAVTVAAVAGDRHIPERSKAV